MNVGLRTDAIEIEVFARIFGALVEQMAVTVLRTAHTTFVREVQDFGTALSTPEGRFFAYPRTLGGSTLLGLPFEDCINAVECYEPGDVLFTNDPFLSGAGCSHVPDLTLWSPVFVDGELLCFSWGYIHSSDIGGAVSGSIAPSFSETFQEGIRIPTTKLYRRGEVNDELKRILLNNVRIPEQMWGDIRALCAAFNVAERKVRDLARRYGADRLRAAAEDLLSYSEMKARAVFRGLPDGTYRFADYLEDDTVSDVPVRIELAMTVSNGTIHLDYTGTDPQVASAYNVPTAGKVHPWVIAGLGNYIVSQDPDIPTNAGFFRALSVTLPKGSIVYPVFPAAIGVRSVTGTRILDVLLGALARAAPEKVPAAGSGVSTIVLLSVPDYERGTRRINVINPCVGGSGGRPMNDGFDGVDFTLAFMRNTPAEILEAETFVLMRRFGFIPDSGGPGRFRGGLGVRLEFQVLAPDATIIARGMERTRFAPWGVHGGLPGAHMPPAVVNPGTAGERRVRKIDILRVDPGDVVRIDSPGGGGYGDPLERDPDRVWADVENGFVSSRAAREAYGVVLDSDGRVDHTATDALRVERRRGRDASNPTYSFGEERASYESTWPAPAREALARVLERLPVLMRYHVKNALYTALASGRRDRPITAEEVAAAWREMRVRMSPERYLDPESVSRLAGPSG